MTSQHHRQHLAFYALVAGAFAVLTIPRMAQTGMFLDGVTYAAIARNLSEGIGTFWFLSYTSTLLPVFHDHPPLAFGLQALAFAIIGDHVAVERVYSILMGGLVALLMVLIWRSTVRDSAYDWLPVVFWLLPAGVTWSVVNNMLENTQTVFTTLAVLAFVRSLDSARASYGWACLAGLSVLGAVLTKGPVGLFPLAAPVILALVMRHHTVQALRSGAVMFGALVIGAALIIWPPGPRAALSSYWDQQVVASVTGARGQSGGRLISLARHLGGGVIVRMGALVALPWLWSSVRKSRDRSRPSAWSWFFVALALAGSLPVAFSARITGHYFVPSLPIYALAFASLVLPVIRPTLDRCWHRLATVAGSLGVALLVASAAVPLIWGPVPRDVDWIAEYRTLSPSIPRGTTMGTCEAVRTNWGLHAYMQRLFKVSLDPEQGRRHRYYLQFTDRACDVPRACEPITSSNRLTLLECAGN